MNNCNDNQKLESTLYKELVSYKDNLHDLSHIIRRNLPKWAVHRLISNLQKNKNVKEDERINTNIQIQNITILMIKDSMSLGRHGDCNFEVFDYTPISTIKEIENLNCEVNKIEICGGKENVLYIFHIKW